MLLPASYSRIFKFQSSIFRNVNFMQCFSLLFSFPHVRTSVLFLMLGDYKESLPKVWLNFCMCEQGLYFVNFTRGSYCGGA